MGWFHRVISGDFLRLRNDLEETEIDLETAEAKIDSLWRELVNFIGRGKTYKQKFNTDTAKRIMRELETLYTEMPDVRGRQLLKSVKAVQKELNHGTVTTYDSFARVTAQARSLGESYHTTITDELRALAGMKKLMKGI